MRAVGEAGCVRGAGHGRAVGEQAQRGQVPALAFDLADRGQLPGAVERVRDIGIDEHAAGPATLSRGPRLFRGHAPPRPFVAITRILRQGRNPAGSFNG